MLYMAQTVIEARARLLEGTTKQPVFVFTGEKHVRVSNLAELHQLADRLSPVLDDTFNRFLGSGRPLLLPKRLTRAWRGGADLVSAGLGEFVEAEIAARAFLELTAEIRRMAGLAELES